MSVKIIHVQNEQGVEIPMGDYQKLKKKYQVNKYSPN